MLFNAEYMYKVCSSKGIEQRDVSKAASGTLHLFF